MDNTDLLAPVLTKAALLKKNKNADFKAEIFEMQRLPKNNLDTDKLQRTQSRHEEDGFKDGNVKEKKTDEGPEFDMKRARYEVFNLGLSGFKSKNKRKAEIAVAVKLGAKAPKKAYRNYKELLAEKKRGQEMREQQLKFRQLGKNQVGAASVRCKKPKANKRKVVHGEISQHYGVVNPKMVKRKK